MGTRGPEGGAATWTQFHLSLHDRVADSIGNVGACRSEVKPRSPMGLGSVVAEHIGEHMGLAMAEDAQPPGVVH